MRFLLNTLVLSLPFYLLALLAVGGVLPNAWVVLGISLGPLAPLLAALREARARPDWGGFRAYFAGVFDRGRWPRFRWLLAACGLVPALLIFAAVGLQLAGAGTASPRAPIFALPLLAVVFFIAAAAEELGWMGEAYPRYQARWGRVRGTSVLAFIWLAWHIPYYVLMFATAGEIVAHGVVVVALRFLMVDLYERAGASLLVVVLMHTAFNVGLALVPVYGMASPWGIVAVAALTGTAALWFWHGRANAAESEARISASGGGGSSYI